MTQAKQLHGAVNVLVAVAGVAAGSNPFVAGTAAAMSGIGSILDLLPFWRKSRTTLHDRVQGRLEATLAQNHLTDDQRLLIPQMLERVSVSPEDIIRCARSAEGIARAMAGACQGGDPAHAAPATQDAFIRVVTDIMRDVLADQDACDELRPLQEQAVAQSLKAIGETVEGISVRQQDQHAEVRVPFLAWHKSCSKCRNSRPGCWV